MRKLRSQTLEGAKLFMRGYLVVFVFAFVKSTIFAIM
jgi:hypothetical protein